MFDTWFHFDVDGVILSWNTAPNPSERIATRVESKVAKLLTARVSNRGVLKIKIHASKITSTVWKIYRNRPTCMCKSQRLKRDLWLYSSSLVGRRIVQPKAWYDRMQCLLFEISNDSRNLNEELPRGNLCQLNASTTVQRLILVHQPHQT